MVRPQNPSIIRQVYTDTTGAVVLKQKISLILGILLAIFFLWFSLKDTNFSDIGAALAQANYWFSLPFILIFTLYFIVKAIRWALLLKPAKRISLGEILPSTVIGYTGNLIFPAYIGEFGRAYILARQTKLDYSSILASIFLERMWDFLTLFAFVGVVLMLEEKLPQELTQAGYFISIIVIMLALLISLYITFTKPFIELINRMLFFLPGGVKEKILPQLGKAALGFESIKHPALLSKVAFYSLLHWALIGLCLYLSLLAFDIKVPYSAAFIILILIVAGMSLPNTPGFFGTIQICFVLGLRPYEVSADVAFAASIFYHLIMYVFTFLAGIYYFRRAGVSLGQLREESRSGDNIAGSD